MRLLMLNNEFPPLGGGTGTVNQAILQRFAQVPWLQIDLITSALGRKYEQEQLAERIACFKVPVHNRDIHHSSNRELLTYAFRALVLSYKLHRQNPYDFCFAWSAVPAGGVALALRRLTGLRYLVRVCGPDIPGFEQRYGALYPILTPVIKAIWHGAETVVAKCRGEANMIWAVDDKVPVQLVPNGVELTAFSPASIPDDGPFHILCVARLIERKGQRHVIEALGRLVHKGYHVHLTLVGTGDARPVYEQLIRALGLEHHVTMAGYVPRDVIPQYYAAAHVFVLPSYNEGMSVATLEALAAGLPIIITQTGGTEELLVEGGNGFSFEWADVDTLTAHLEKLVTDRVLARRMGAASRAHAALFSWDAAAQRYLAMFEQWLTMREA